MKTENEIAGIVECNREWLEEQARKNSGPTQPLTEEEQDRSETEIHNFIRMRGQPKKERG